MVDENLKTSTLCWAHLLWLVNHHILACDMTREWYLKPNVENKQANLGEATVSPLLPASPQGVMVAVGTRWAFSCKLFISCQERAPARALARDMSRDRHPWPYVENCQALRAK